jgi:hypothetical protein
MQSHTRVHPSLRDGSCIGSFHPALKRRAIVERPYGTLTSNAYIPF